MIQRTNLLASILYISILSAPSIAFPLVLRNPRPQISIVNVDGSSPTTTAPSISISTTVPLASSPSIPTSTTIQLASSPSLSLAPTESVTPASSTTSFTPSTTTIEVVSSITTTATTTVESISPVTITATTTMQSLLTVPAVSPSTPTDTITVTFQPSTPEIQSTTSTRRAGHCIAKYSTQSSASLPQQTSLLASLQLAIPASSSTAQAPSWSSMAALMPTLSASAQPWSNSTGSTDYRRRVMIK